MKIINLLTFLTLILLLNACRTDEFDEIPGTIPIDTEIPISVDGNLNGVIVDENLEAISGAQVITDGKSTFTDDNGVFRITNATALSTGSLVEIKKEGYYAGYKFVRFKPGKNSILKVSLIEKMLLSSHPSNTSKTIEVNGAQLFLPADITTLEDGTPYNGNINVRAHWYDPTDERTIATMPGDLRGIDINGKAVQLTTYGMIVVELIGDNNEILQLKTGMTARLTFPVPPSFEDEQLIPMWYLDEDSGIWMEEGFAERQANTIVAEVSHFSYWNCDDSSPIVQIKGGVITKTGIPVSGLEIVITDLQSNISGYGYTNEDGIFSAAVPAGKELTLSTFSCSQLEGFYNLEPLTLNTDLKDIEIDTDNFIELTATLQDCYGDLVEEGLALLITDTSFDITYANLGQINYALSSCLNGEGFLVGMNIQTNEISDSHTFDLNETFVSLGDVKVCDETIALEDRITFFLTGGDTVTLTDVEVTRVDNRFIHIYAVQPGTDPLVYTEILYHLDEIEEDDLYQYHEKIIVAAYDDNGDYKKRTLSGSTNWTRTSANNVGDLVTGNYNGINMSCTFSCKIDKDISSARVTGAIWVDNNQNGIREAGENDTFSDVDITAVDHEDNREFWNYYTEFTTTSDGSFELKGLARNKEIRLDAFISDYELTLYQVGNSTTDNDFFQENNSLNVITNYFTPTLDVTTDFGLGIYK